MKIDDLKFNKVDFAQGMKCDKDIIYLDQVGSIINLSSIFSRLIKDAAQCESYNSDIVYMFDEIREKIVDAQKSDEEMRIYMGFRDSGIDPTSFINERLDRVNNWEDAYNKVYCVCIKGSNLTIDVTLNVAE